MVRTLPQCRESSSKFVLYWKSVLYIVPLYLPLIFYSYVILDLNSLESIVVMLQQRDVRKRTTTLSIYNICQGDRCEDLTSVILDSLTPYSVGAFPRYFLILSTGKSFKKIIEQVSLKFVVLFFNHAKN